MCSSGIDKGGLGLYYSNIFFIKTVVLKLKITVFSFVKEKSIDALKKILKINSEDAKFMRKGKAGNWKTEMSREQIRRMVEWEERQMANTGFTFQYD